MIGYDSLMNATARAASPRETRTTAKSIETGEAESRLDRLIVVSNAVEA